MDLGLRERYERFTRTVADAARELGRDPAAITIVAVTKTQPAAALRAGRDAGLSDIGENYVQEARAKFEEAQVAGLRRHFIGHIQTNKARAIVELFDFVQSIDRLDAARALSRAAASAGKRLPVLLQVNVSPTDRFGCPPGDAGSLAEAVRAEAGLDLQGVMAIGPAADDRAEVARSFDLARSVCEQIGGTVLSIGMSGDWREALAAGSTMLRVGTGLFGPRPRKAELAATSKT
ncbi:MAG: YggS family pyridoxal phosphate-dependent enzyme [Candidatus Eremiobacteraeota bacterium]|nr:YggS family pyridoxal phosphate-dependent enzyme [Candidatus Eremiobacteraeota bacterium]